MTAAGRRPGRDRGAAGRDPAVRALDARRRARPRRARPADAACRRACRGHRRRAPPASSEAVRRCGRRPTASRRPRCGRAGGTTCSCATPVNRTRGAGISPRWPRDAGSHPVDVMLDVALADGFETQVASVMRNGDDDELGRLVTHPAAMIGASDAGAHVLSNTDSCYAVWTLQHWVRERWRAQPRARRRHAHGGPGCAPRAGRPGRARAPGWPPISCSSIRTGSPRRACATSTTNPAAGAGSSPTRPASGSASSTGSSPPATAIPPARGRDVGCGRRPEPGSVAASAPRREPVAVRGGQPKPPGTAGERAPTGRGRARWCRPARRGG